MTRARLDAIAREATAAAGPDGRAIFKWTCGSCGERAAFNEPNVLYTKAVHEERLNGTRCGHVTDLVADTEKAAVGYALLIRVDETIAGSVIQAIERRDAVRRQQ